ncbi:S8 family serine peptidase [Hymenobacter sp. BT683]|uniref:S8 family serine peptidase n=1 Tax=Hymenobacter jeongseonensis TaxID=2791027 RepID=A0ABS0ID74_9BACT|nr:S8 family serine peptidase [Hymenobacter jeongseonensis]MBF9236294.1 S8 family serine peptidase [Hymenobacter jeongseonensis]
MLTAVGTVQAQAPVRPAPTAKLAPTLQAATAQKTLRTVRVRVTDKAAFEQWVRQQLPAARVSQPTASASILDVTGLTAAAVPKLVACPVVSFIDVADRQARTERRLNNSDLSINAIAAVQAQFSQLNGQGLTVSVKEGPFDPNDIDFKGRVVNVENFPGPPSPHATDMATLIGGAGNSHPKGRGVAREVRLATSDFARLLPDDGSQLAQDGISVQNHSYGVAIENYYGLETQEYDRQVQQFPSLLHVFSSGNSGALTSAEGPYTGIAAVANVTGQFKMSKNTLTVGATDPSGQVSALSSRGPAYDGRVKPELVAYGEGGSSESAALVSGISLLLQQVHRDQHSGTLPPAALVKAVLVNSANDLGRPEVDFVSGFGQADALGAINTMRDRRFFNETVAQGTEQVLTITVPAGQQQLKASLVWNDPDAPAGAARALVNDLDLELVSRTTGQRWQPWALSAYPHADSLALPARRRADHVNNIEQITLAVPAAGTYELRVRGFSVPQGPQAFSLAYEVSPVGLEWLSPQSPGNVPPNAATTLRWHWSGPPTTARLEYRPVGNAQWRVVNGAVALADNRYTWTVPDTTTLAQLRLVTGSQSFTSGEFAIVRVPPLQVGYTCPDETLLQWARVPGATQYQVYQLGATTLEPLLRTADTIVVLNRTQMASRYYAMAPVLQGKVADPGGTIDYTTQGTVCYFRSFMPRQLVDNTIQFNVELGSLYRLQSATLERLGAAGYEAVQTIAPLTTTKFTFTDLPPAAARYLYRVRLENLAGQQFYSQVEETYYLQTGAAQVFPNPVLAGEDLRLIAGTSSPVSIRLYDMLGKLQRETTVEGVINQLDTNGLKPGLYLLRVTLDSQAEQTIRVVIQ